MGGLDIAECCRLCLKDASSATAVRIDLQENQTISDLIYELYALNIKSSDRGSTYICMPCYQNAAGLKKYLDSHRTKTLLATTNQKILEIQAESFPEAYSDDDVVDCDLRTGYRPPISSPVEMLLNLRDCMRSKRFRDALNDQYELGYILLSGPIYQKDDGTVLDEWHPVQLYCRKCRRKFEDQVNLDDHTISCKFKCMFCRRNYAHEESLLLHSCPRRDKHKQSRKRRLKPAMPVAEVVPPVADQETTVAVVNAEQSKEDENVLPIPDSIPAHTDTPRIEGEASLDTELTHLLERWYGQGEEIQELSHLTVGAIDAPQENGTFTNSDLYGRIIESSFQKDSAVAKPAISVKPMSQLVETPVEQTLPATVPEIASTCNPSEDIIEIDDDDDVVACTSTTVADKPEQALSETDILSIVKHFRGIDENESYLVKAKINGAQKLICISKRKNEGGVQSSVVSTISENNSALQTGSRNPSQNQIAIPPTMSRANTVMQPASTGNPSAMVKHASDVNGISISPAANTSRGPQLKISHVQSLVSDVGLAQNSMSTNPPRLLNGIPHRIAASTASIATRKIPSASFTVRHATPRQSPVVNKPAPQRIIVGSNSLKFTGSSGQRYVPIAPKNNPGPNPPRASAQQRIIVQRKQVQTIIQSSTVTRTNSEGSVQSTTSSSCTTDINNSLLRSQLLQQPPIVYPSASGAAQNGNRSSVSKALDELSTTTNQFTLNDTTIKRLN